MGGCKNEPGTPEYPRLTRYLKRLCYIIIQQNKENGKKNHSTKGDIYGNQSKTLTGLFILQTERKESEDMKKMDKIKALVTAAGSFLSSLLGVLFIPVMLLVACNIIDYITGLMASPNRKEKVSSYKSIMGIMKKICMWLLVIVGAIIDQLIKYSVSAIGLTAPFTFLVACIVAIWLICNELISILENIADTGTDLPPFLEKIVYYIREQAESKVDMDETENK